MEDRVDNKKKWRVVAIVAFSLLFPHLMSGLITSGGGYEAWFGWAKDQRFIDALARQALHLGPPVAAMYFLPYGRNARIAIIGVYVALFFPVAMHWGK
jgi:hypothetical protein